MVTTAQQVRKGESNAPEKDFDDTSFMRLATWKSKVMVDDYGDPVLSTIVAGDVPLASTGNVL